MYTFYLYPTLHLIICTLDNTVVPVQVDHTTQGLLINGTRWMGHGWYMEALDNDWPALAEYIKLSLVPMGVNVAMTYNLNVQPISVQMTFLDAMQAIDFKSH